MHDGKDLMTSELVIHRFKPSDAGIYKCQFYNDKNGTAEANTTLGMWICNLFALFCLGREVSLIFLPRSYRFELLFCYRVIEKYKVVKLVLSKNHFYKPFF